VFLAKALHANRSVPSCRYPQLATLGTGGRPANRTVVFRGFAAHTNRLQFITDARSAKASHISQNPAAELCWYFSHTREQFRFAGDLILVGEQFPDLELQSCRRQLWQQLSDAARLQFTWPAPGAERHPAQPFPTTMPSQVEPLPHFCLLLLVPIAVDHLCLRGDPQDRWSFRRDASSGEWGVRAINP
jgi:pyridoxamine 5'-phosphate oxidase